MEVQSTTTASTSKSPIMIVMFVILGVIAVALAFYFLYWRRRHPISAQGDDIQVGSAVIITFSTTEAALCATTATPHQYHAYGVVTALSGTQATVFWAAMYDTQDSTCQFVRGAKKGTAGWEAQWMGVGTTAATNVPLSTVVDTSSLAALSPSNY